MRRCRISAIDPIVAAAQIVTGAPDHHQPQHPSARKRGRQRHADPWRRHLERHSRQRGAARHDARVQAEIARPDGAGDPPHRRRRRCRGCGAEMELRYERRYPADLERCGGDRDRGRCRRRSGRRRQCRARHAAEHGRGGFRLHARGKARAAISGSATAPRDDAAGCCTTRITISTTRSCRSARAIGCGSPKRRWQKMGHPPDRDKRVGYRYLAPVSQRAASGLPSTSASAPKSARSRTRAA